MSKKKLAGMSCVMVNSKGGGNITTKQIYGAKHLVIEGTGSIVANSVMNGIFYPEAELEKIASDSVGWIHAPNGHPTDPEGNFVPAGSPHGVMQGYIGAMSGNYRMENRRLVRDIAINIEVAERTEAGRELLRKVNAGEDVDTSTGLLFIPQNTAGVGEDGEKYTRVATNIMLDHDAILMQQRGAATSDQGVGFFANSADDTAEVEFTEATNASIPAMTLDVADIEYDEAAAVERIKAYTKSTTKPGINYRRFFLQFDRANPDDFASYSMPFADVVDGKPVAVLSQIKKYKQELNGSSADGLERAREAVERYSALNSVETLDKVCEAGLIERISKKVINAVASFMKNDYNRGVDLNLNQPEDDPMKEKILAALNAAGVKTEGLNDDQLFDAYSSLASKKEPAKNHSNADDIATAINSALATQLAAQLKPMQDQFTAIQATLNASKEAELNDLAAKVEALDIGLNAATAKTLGVDGMKSLIAKNAGVVNFNSATNAQFDKNLLGDLPE